jgi:hypothetical protein
MLRRLSCPISTNVTCFHGSWAGCVGIKGDPPSTTTEPPTLAQLPGAAVLLAVPLAAALVTGLRAGALAHELRLFGYRFGGEWRAAARVTGRRSGACTYSPGWDPVR